MLEPIQLTLDELDVGQMLDGLEVRANAWRHTARYLETGEAPYLHFVAEECSDSAEASRLADHYERIIESIQKQLERQSGVH